MERLNFVAHLLVITKTSHLHYIHCTTYIISDPNFNYKVIFCSCGNNLSIVYCNVNHILNKYLIIGNINHTCLIYSQSPKHPICTTYVIIDQNSNYKLNYKVVENNFINNLFFIDFQCIFQNNMDVCHNPNVTLGMKNLMIILVRGIDLSNKRKLDIFNHIK